MGIPTIFGSSVDLFFKEEELAFPVFDSKSASGPRITALTVND